MTVSVEISYYPLSGNFIPPIRNFIDKINQYEGLKVVTNGMSTQIFGEYSLVMNALTTEIRKAMELPHSVFVMKIVNADLSH